jgi:hypothetical protein
VLELSRTALLPTIEAGEIDTALRISKAPYSKRMGAVWAIKIKDGAAIERMQRDIVKKHASDKQVPKIVFDAEKAGSVSLHRMDASEWNKNFGKEAAAAVGFLGDDPFYLAYLPDAAIVSMGANSLALMKAALAVQSKAGPLLRIQLSPKLMVDSMDEKAPGRDILARMKGNFALTVEGGSALTVRVEGIAVLVDAAVQGVRDALGERNQGKPR